MAWSEDVAPPKGVFWRFVGKWTDGCCFWGFALPFVVGGFAIFFAEGSLGDSMESRGLLEADELDALEIGDEVWLEVDLQGPEESSASEDWFQDHIYGCRSHYDGGDEGSWEVDLHFSPVLVAAVGDRTLLVQLPEDCPRGTESVVEPGKNEQGQDLKFRGYRSDQQVSLLGEVVELSPLKVQVEEHRGGSGKEHLDSVRTGSWVGFGFFFIAMMLVLGVAWYQVTGFKHRKGWKRFADQRSLKNRGLRIFGLGRIHGSHRGREVELARRRGLGDGEVLPSDLALRIALNPCMKPYEMRGQAAIERWFLVLGGEEEIGDRKIDPLFVLRGVDGGRWKALLSDPEVRKSLLEMRENNVQLGMNEGWLTLSWPGIDPKVMAHVFEHGMALAERMEKVEGRGWSEAATALRLEFQIDAESHWSICSELPRHIAHVPTLPHWELRYAREPEGWQTRLELSLSKEVSEHCWITERARPKIPVAEDMAQRCGDPVLDAQIYFMGFEEGRLQELVARPEATEILLAGVCGHGLHVFDQKLFLRHAGLVAEPRELIEDALRLARLLEGGD